MAEYAVLARAIAGRVDISCNNIVHGQCLCQQGDSRRSGCMGFERSGAQRNGACGRGGYLVAMGFEGWLGYEERVGRLDLAQLESLVRRTKYCICRLRIRRARSG
jgi:hypothetical protein